MYDVLGICLVLGAALTVNALASAVAASIWRAFLERRTRGWPAATRAQLIFALRISPPAVALAAVAALLVPSYLVYEPRATAETVSLKLAILAVSSALGIALALWRSLAAWRATRQLATDWIRHGEPAQFDGVNIPAFRICHSFPVIAVVGVLRPRLFVASRVLEELEPEEVAAAIKHEAGHLAARDNFKRGALRACRDVLALVPCARSLDLAWAESAEAAADEFAAQDGATAALNLAAALVKIARIAPVNARPAMPAGVFLLGERESGVAWRVRRLLQLATSSAPEENRRLARGVRWVWRGCLGAFVAGLALIAANPHILATMHAAIERIVQALA